MMGRDEDEGLVNENDEDDEDEDEMNNREKRCYFVFIFYMKKFFENFIKNWKLIDKKLFKINFSRKFIDYNLVYRVVKKLLWFEKIYEFKRYKCWLVKW